MWRHYVYLHLKKDTGEVFYVGKGTLRKNRTPFYERAIARHSRNPFWRAVEKKHGYEPVIFASCKTDEAAQELEKSLISENKRRNLYADGVLVNLTDGGDGHCGIIATDELREKRRRNSRGPRSSKWIAAIRKARKNGGNGGVVKKGDKLSETWRKNISLGQKGPNNYMRGRTGKDSPNARRVIDVKSNKVYESVQEAADINKVAMKTLYNWLSGHRKNPTNLRFY